MIILSGVLVVVAIALLVTGIVTGNTGHEILGLDGLKLIYVSIGVSVVSALFLAVGVFLRRKELFGTTAAPANAKASAGRTTARPVKAKARVGAGQDTPIVPAPSATATDVPAETTVWVVPGRKRYHLETCRQLAGRDKEELTFVEAHEEGFTACTACLPDTALAARAALTDTEPVGDRPAETRTAADTDTKPQSAALDPVEATRTDIPVTPALPSAEERDARTESRAPIGGATEPPNTDARDAESTIVEPAAAEPTSAELTDAEASEETLVERSRRRSRSLFEPMERTETDDTAAADTTDAGSATDEKTGTGSADAAGHREEDEAATARSADEPEAAEPQDAPGTADEDADVAAAAEADATDHVGSEAQDDRAADDTVAAGSESQAAEFETAESDRAESEMAASELASSDEHDERGEHDQRDEEVVAAEAGTEPEPVDDETDATDDEPDADAATPSTESSADADAEQAEENAEPADDSGDAKADPTVHILSGTKRYHRSDCALIEDIADDADDLESMSREAARERGCTPCLVCQPADD